MTDNLEIQYGKLRFTEVDEKGRLSEKNYRLIGFPDGRRYLAWFHRNHARSEVLFNTLNATPASRDIGDDNRLGAFPDIEIGDQLDPETVKTMAGI
jgi:hypothetical protein